MQNDEGRANRMTICPLCKTGKLDADRRPYVSDYGFIHRARICDNCGNTVYTKQGPEELTGTSKQQSAEIRH